jgi:uncharacterized repeat protein (TIGR03803 family)
MAYRSFGQHILPTAVVAVEIDSDGNFYGTTSAGGNKLDGTIFELTVAGFLTIL